MQGGFRKSLYGPCVPVAMNIGAAEATRPVSPVVRASPSDGIAAPIRTPGSATQARVGRGSMGFSLPSCSSARPKTGGAVSWTFHSDEGEPMHVKGVNQDEVIVAY